MTGFYMERNTELKWVITRLILIIIAHLKEKKCIFHYKNYEKKLFFYNFFNGLFFLLET